MEFVFMKRKPALHTQKKQNDSWGFVGVLLLLIVVAFGFLLAGGLTFEKRTQDIGNAGVPAGSGYFCCDSGDGDACKTSDTQKFIWKGDEYALIKSGIALSEGSGHLAPASPPDDKTPNGDRIFLNTSDTSADYSGVSGECEKGKDLVFGPNGCSGIPNDEIIYVCRGEGCGGSVGTGTFDAYFRLKDGAIPDVIKNCVKPKGGDIGGGQQEIVIVPEEGKTNLQLQTFKVIEKSTPASWLSPYCKPAIYLYPKEKANVNVQIAPVGRLTLTIPKYNSNGWNVTAYPSGKLNYQNSAYEYLYYEAEIPDDKIMEPKEGFTVEYGKLSIFFSNLLPKLGLNQNESSEFISYWIRALPQSPYYLVGIVDRKTLDTIAPLSINPKPDNVIRVTLYFKALDKTIDINEPKISFPKRDGFTVVEWGGIYKKHKNEAFSCFL